LFGLLRSKVEHIHPTPAAVNCQPKRSEQAPGAGTARLKTKEEAAQWFADRGITISEWTLARKFNPSLVYQVLAGTRKAVRGDGFKIAVALGMKSVPADEDLPATNQKRTEVEPAAAN
jgi:gp16 family phage-associated protein